jgi:hypothetical protein
MKQPLRIAGLALLTALAACSAADCDPSRAGFIDGIGCAGGGYQLRQTSLNQGVAIAQANELEQKAKATQAAGTAASAQADLAARQRRMAKLDANLAGLRQRLHVASARQGVDQQAVRQISAQIDELYRQQAASRSNPVDANLHAMEDRQRQLVKMLDDLN